MVPLCSTGGTGVSGCFWLKLWPWIHRIQCRMCERSNKSCSCKCLHYIVPCSRSCSEKPLSNPNESCQIWKIQSLELSVENQGFSAIMRLKHEVQFWQLYCSNCSIFGWFWWQVETATNQRLILVALHSTVTTTATPQLTGNHRRDAKLRRTATIASLYVPQDYKTQAFHPRKHLDISLCWVTSSSEGWI